jgi:hypothetical protein
MLLKPALHRSFSFCEKEIGPKLLKKTSAYRKYFFQDLKFRIAIAGLPTKKF